MNTNLYVKSFEEDFALKTLIDGIKHTSQNLEDILSSKIIIPNTISFWQKYRLSTTLLWEKHTITYRPQGLVFTTKEKSDYIYPFDLIVLTANNTFEVEYYKDPLLHNHYSRNLIPWYEYFKCKDYSDMIEKFWDINHLLEEVNTFRQNNWFAEIPWEKIKLIQYNEAVFHEPISIEIVGVFGKHINQNIKSKINELWIKIYNTAEECFLDIKQ